MQKEVLGFRVEGVGFRGEVRGLLQKGCRV